MGAAPRKVNWKENKQNSSGVAALFFISPSVFNSFFTKTSQIHTYNTRLGAKQSYYLPKARTNYGIFNIRFQGPSVWNSIDEDIKLSSLSLFKKKMKQHFIKDY